MPNPAGTDGLGAALWPAAGPARNGCRLYAPEAFAGAGKSRRLGCPWGAVCLRARAARCAGWLVGGGACGDGVTGGLMTPWLRHVCDGGREVQPASGMPRDAGDEPHRCRTFSGRRTRVIRATLADEAPGAISPGSRESVRTSSQTASNAAETCWSLSRCLCCGVSERGCGAAGGIAPTFDRRERFSCPDIPSGTTSRRRRARPGRQAGCRPSPRSPSEMIVAVKEGADQRTLPATPWLATVIAKAKAANMPNDNIKRAHGEGLGGAGNAGDNYETVTYEGYGPGWRGRDCGRRMTDNRNPYRRLRGAPSAATSTARATWAPPAASPGPFRPGRACLVIEKEDRGL